MVPCKKKFHTVRDEIVDGEPDWEGEQFLSFLVAYRNWDNYSKENLQIEICLTFVLESAFRYRN